MAGIGSNLIRNIARLRSAPLSEIVLQSTRVLPCNGPSAVRLEARSLPGSNSVIIQDEVKQVMNCLQLIVNEPIYVPSTSNVSYYNNIYTPNTKPVSIPQPPYPITNPPSTSPLISYQFDSVLKKRRRKMKKHQYRKRRKKFRMRLRNMKAKHHF